MRILSKEIVDLKQKAKWLRRETLKLALETKNGHMASAFSIVELLISLYYKVLTPDDKFILSKGHGCLAFFPILRDKGFNPKISGHPDIQPEEGIECTTGSLGHGLPIGVGMALAKKIKKEKGNLYVLMGDGECQEGATWESLLLCNKFKLDNLTIIIDRNQLQALGNTETILPLGDLWTKFNAFDVYASVIDGHSFDWIIDALKTRIKGKTKVIISNTTKGKGLSFMEGVPMWHHRSLSEELLKQAETELA